MIWLYSILALLTASTSAKHVHAPHQQHAQVELCDQGECAIGPRQGSFGGATTGSVLQPFSTTYTYTFWSYSPVTAVETTTFQSSRVTTSIIITVFAVDQFHALQSLLTAGQSVQESANSSAAQVTRTPASVSATATPSSSATTESTTTLAASSNAALTSRTTASTTGGVGCGSTPSIRHGIALAGALAWANL